MPIEDFFDREIGVVGPSIESIEERAKDWASDTIGKLKSSVFSNATESGKLANSLSYFVRKYNDSSMRISFQFNRYGVFREKGAGKGYGGKKGSKWTNKKGEKKTTNPQSLNKAGTGARKLQPWFNPVIRQEIDELAKAVGEHYELVLKKIFIR